MSEEHTHALRLHASPSLSLSCLPCQACIDQQNIDASLACLPVFIAGVKELLCLVGPSYAERLWW